VMEIRILRDELEKASKGQRIIVYLNGFAISAMASGLRANNAIPCNKEIELLFAGRLDSLTIPYIAGQAACMQF